MARKRTPSQARPTLAYIWKKVTHNWSWFDSIISGTLMFAVGYVIGWAAAEDLPILQVTRETLLSILKMWAVFLFTSRGWQIARMPRGDTYKLKDMAWRHIIHLNYVSWAHYIIAFAFTYSLAPEIGQIANAWFNGE